MTDRMPCDALFIDPALGRIGKSEAEAAKTGRKRRVGAAILGAGIRWTDSAKRGFS
jgi:pyruvate/2-oxoglutarate dehydrogenase complex dihydrolipoamide dehydrogenase (E3) component